MKRLKSLAQAFLLNRIILFLLRWYQKIISPDHSAIVDVYGDWRCRFFPSCSEYAVLAFRQYGFFRASVASCRRIAHCHPWTRGGYDPLKDELNQTKPPDPIPCLISHSSLLSSNLNAQSRND